MYKSVALTVAVLLAVFKTGSCVQCYQCTSEQDKFCADPYKSSKPPVDCGLQDSINFNNLYLRSILPSDVMGTVVGAPRYCYKIVMESGSVVRTCLDTNPADMNHTCRAIDMASKASFVPQTKVKYCGVCNGDKCNGAGSIAVSLPVATFALIATYFLCKQ